MRPIQLLIAALTLAAALSVAHGDHLRPGMFGDIGTPAAAEDPSHGVTTTALMVRRCSALLRTVRSDREGHIRRYKHNYDGGFCIGWINSAMVFMNLRDSDGSQMLNVCLPEGIHTRTVIETFLDFVKRHPDDAKYNPSFLIYWSLLEKYPCRQS